MSTTQARSTATRTSPARAALHGAGAGAVASLPMGIYAMGASFAKDTGFFTPLHHIASLFAAPDAMMESMAAHQTEGEAFVLTAGVALLGAVIHMMTGAMYGALLGVALVAVLARANPGTAVLAGIGLGFGALVFAISAFVGLPAAAALFGAGEPIADMASMAGWWTFLVEHLVFGVVAALVAAAALRRRA